MAAYLLIGVCIGFFFGWIVMETKPREEKEEEKSEFVKAAETEYLNKKGLFETRSRKGGKAE